MNIVFLLIPLACLGAIAILRTFSSLTPLKADERGITLQTVIVTAVLALAAAGAGIVIYNVVAGEAKEAKANADEACNNAGDSELSQSALTLGACDIS